MNDPHRCRISQECRFAHLVHRRKAEALHLGGCTSEALEALNGGASAGRKIRIGLVVRRNAPGPGVCFSPPGSKAWQSLGDKRSPGRRVKMQSGADASRPLKEVWLSALTLHRSRPYNRLLRPGRLQSGLVAQEKRARNPSVCRFPAKRRTWESNNCAWPKAQENKILGAADSRESLLAFAIRWILGRGETMTALWDARNFWRKR
jgi:hypothetical protein